MALDNFRTQKIIWDRANKKIFETIEANSGDSNGRKLVVQVINQETTENLFGTTLSLGWKSRKGAKGLDAFNVVDASKGIFEIYYTTEMLSNIGNLEASLILIDSTGRIESSAFTISVRPSTVDDESVESENSFTALTEALVKVNDFSTQLAQTNAGLNQRIDNLVVPLTEENANLEVTDAHVSVTKGKTFPTLTHRFEETEKEIFEVSSHRTVLPTYTEGAYINSIGQIAAQEGWKYSEPIPLKKFEKIKVNTRGVTGTLSIITKTDATGENRTPLVISVDNMVKVHEYTATEDMYVIVSGHISIGIDISIITDIQQALSNVGETLTEVSDVLYTRDVSPTYVLGSYVHREGHIATSEGWKYSEPFALHAFEKITVTTKGAGTNVSIITKTDALGENRTPLVTSIDSSVREYTYTANEDMFIIVSGNVSADIKLQVDTDLWQTISNLTANTLTKEPDVLDYSVLFQRALHIGDSLTRGFYGEYPSGERNRSFHYPLAMAQKTGWDYTNLGISGSTPSSWLTAHSDTDLSGYDVVFICLGRNGNLQDSADITAYHEIVTKLKTESPNAVIFILSLPPSNVGSETNVNPIAKDIAEQNQLPYLDITTTGLMNQSNGHLYRPADGVHFNKIGYATLGLTILEQMNNYINKHVDEFVTLPVAK